MNRWLLFGIALLIAIVATCAIYAFIGFVA